LGEVRPGLPGRLVDLVAGQARERHGGADGVRGLGLVQQEAGLVVGDEDRAHQTDGAAGPGEDLGGHPGALAVSGSSGGLALRAVELDEVLGHAVHGAVARRTAKLRKP